MALWQSVNQVHFADGSIDYLGLICYHDEDIENNNYFPIGTIKRQGEIFFHTGEGGTAYGDHVHLETGKGQVNLNDYRYHFTDNSQCRRIVPDDVLFVNDTYVVPYNGYNWVEYDGGITPPPPHPAVVWEKKKFKWYLYARKIRKKNILT